MGKSNKCRGGGDIEWSERGPGTIEVVGVESAHRFGDVLPRIYGYQHRVFKEEQNYRVKSHRSMCWDRWDGTPATHYFVAQERHGQIQGHARFFPCSHPTMISELWPYLLDEELPRSARIWESSRFAVTAPSPLRARIVQELVVGHLELARAEGIEAFVGVMQPRHWRRCLEDLGWPVHYLGPVTTLPGDPYSVVAARFDVSDEIERIVRERTGIHHSVLSWEPRVLGEPGDPDDE